MAWNIVRITKRWQRHEVSKYCRENGANVLVQQWVVIKVQFVKKKEKEAALSVKHNKNACLSKEKKRDAEKDFIF